MQKKKTGTYSVEFGPIATKRFRVLFMFISVFSQTRLSSQSGGERTEMKFGCCTLSITWFIVVCSSMVLAIYDANALEILDLLMVLLYDPCPDCKKK